MPIKCKYSNGYFMGLNGARPGKSERIILHLRYLVTPHQMQNCVNYCRNKARVSEREREEENKTTQKIVECAMCVHKCKCTKRNVSFCIFSLFFDYFHRRLSCARIDRFFGATIISTLSVRVWTYWRGWRINHKTGREIYNFSISWKLSRIAFRAREIDIAKRASNTNKTFSFFLHFSLSTVSGLSWLELTLVSKNTTRKYQSRYLEGFLLCSRVFQLISNSNAIR